jgi:hypothetical protein
MTLLNCFTHLTFERAGIEWPYYAALCPHEITPLPTIALGADQLVERQAMHFGIEMHSYLTFSRTSFSGRPFAKRSWSAVTKNAW